LSGITRLRMAVSIGCLALKLARIKESASTGHGNQPLQGTAWWG
jgi:hypothetical protein